MICATCGSENPADQKFCGACGMHLASDCPVCGASNPPAQRFCGECGTELAAPTAQPGIATAPGPVRAASAPVAERRLVSVLFADLVGFTPFAEVRDAEDVRETLSSYFALASEVVGRYGGTIEKFIGDAVMAVWGAPTAQEDDAERAVRAALDLVDAVRGLGSGIEARAGVLTGEAAVTIGATNQGMVAGNLVNTAARLQAVAPPGAVLVGEATQRAAASAIAFEALGEQELKGRSAPIPAWRALRVVAQRGGLRRSDLPEPPFVGREEQLRFLKDSLGATSRGQRARLISITGPAGIGTSRLAWELEKYLDGVAADIYWHRGRSPSYGDGITFWALGEMVRRRAGLAESDDEATTRERIMATVAEFVPDQTDRAWVEPALLTLLGLEPAPPGGREVLFAAWRIFFERIATRGTTILLFEDLQWADTGLLDFIDHLLDWSKGVPLLVVTLARPELFDRRPDWGAARRNSTALALEPLSEDAMRELLAGFVTGLPEASVRTILDRADGIPLYAVETVRALVADGKLVPADGAYRTVGELADLAIPETLRSLIASRLDSLDPADRSLVQDASVVGQTVTLASLSAVSGRPEEDLEVRLRQLVRRELFELEADPRSPERGMYRFVQSLVREVAYATLARAERRQRHLAMARHFEALGDEELAGALAMHYLAAYAASGAGAEAGSIAAQARVALRGAADRAATLGAHDQAATYTVRALALTEDPRDRADLQIGAARSAAAAGQYARAEDLARAAIEDHTRAGDPVAATRDAAELGAIHLDAGELSSAVEVLERAVRELPEDAPGDVRARSLANLSRALMRTTAWRRSVEIADRALAIADPLGIDEVIADAFNNKASSLGFLGRNREAIALLEGSVARAAAGGFVFAELRARGNLASTIWGDEPRISYGLRLENLELARRVGDRRMAIWMGSQSIASAWQVGDEWDEAIARADDILSLAASPVDEGRILSVKSIILVARGDPSDDELRRLDEIAEAAHDPESPAQAHFLRGDRALHRGAFDEATTEMLASCVDASLEGVYLHWAMRPALWAGDLVRAREIVTRLSAIEDARGRLLVADIASGSAGVAALEGRREEALALYLDAWRRYRELRIDGELAACIVDGVMVLGVVSPEVEAAVDEARAIFERVRAASYLRWLDAAKQRPSPVAAERPAAEAAERSTVGSS